MWVAGAGDARPESRRHLCPDLLLVWKHSMSKDWFLWKGEKHWNCIKSPKYWPQIHAASHAFVVYVCRSQYKPKTLLCMSQLLISQDDPQIQAMTFCPVLLPWPLDLTEEFLMKIRRHKVQIFILDLQVVLSKVNYATWQLFLVRGLQNSPLWRKSKAQKFIQGRVGGKALLLLLNKSAANLLWKLEIHHFIAKPGFAYNNSHEQWRWKKRPIRSFFLSLVN